MISYIFQGTLGNVVNVKFNSPFRMETRKGTRRGGVRSLFPVRTAKVLYGYVKKSVYSQGNIKIKNFAPRTFNCLW